MAWSEVKRECVSAEKSLHEVLNSFQRDIESDLDDNVETQLTRLSNLIDKLVACNDADKPPTSKAQIQRLREILLDNRSKFRTAQLRHRQAREGEALRKSIKREHAEDRQAESLLMQERSSLMNSVNMTSNIIGQAVETRNELIRQRATFTGSAGRMVDVARQVPGINTLIKRIEDKRTRDNTVIALVIAVCICVLLWYWLAGYF